MNKLTWKHIDYNNDSLNSIARNIAEYHTAHALKVKYSTTKGVPLGTIFLDDNHTVENISVLNSILNYNIDNNWIMLMPYEEFMKQLLEK